MNDRIFLHYEQRLLNTAARVNNRLPFLTVEYECSFPGIDPAAMAVALACDGCQIVFIDSTLPLAGNKKKEQHFNALRSIWDNLQAGKIYGKMFVKCRFPFFDPMLFKTSAGLIGWHHFGSSAEENTVLALLWTIETIFHTTPEKFVQLYECRDNDL